ncbi:MAG: ribonuclease HI [Proteobacteria bacterium]|nr:ribonuclease HI [Pseudomonadota bacterium]MBU1687801.1 ribonuclease HI [Pseudomonadota bacterium]
MAAKYHWYGVAKGRTPGIYSNWPETQAQVKGFAGAVFKGFVDRGEAEAWLKNPVLKRRAPGLNGTGNDQSPPVPAIEPHPDEITIYTDGGSINNPGPGGYGVVMIYDGVRRELTGGFRRTTNNRMELMGCIAALRELPVRNRRISLFSDSSYVVNGVTKGWARGWQRRGWRKADGQPALNADLWAELLELIAQLDIGFNWVRGHSGNPLNERCDELAVTTARQAGLPEDIGYTR